MQGLREATTGLGASLSTPREAEELQDNPEGANEKSPGRSQILCWRIKGKKNILLGWKVVQVGRPAWDRPAMEGDRNQGKGGEQMTSLWGDMVASTVGYVGGKDGGKANKRKRPWIPDEEYWKGKGNKNHVGDDGGRPCPIQIEDFAMVVPR